MCNNLKLKNYNPYFMENISINIKKYRIKANMTRAELASYIGVSSDFIKKIEESLGNRGLSLNTLYKISLALNVSVNDFFINTKKN